MNAEIIVHTENLEYATGEDTEWKYEIPGFRRRQYVDVYITVGTTS